jgi:hypothetical protein
MPESLFCECAVKRFPLPSGSPTEDGDSFGYCAPWVQELLAAW